MRILGLSIGENSTAALMVDGAIVAAASEERFSRLKNDERVPLQAIAYCLKEGGIAGKDLDLVAVAGLELGFAPWVTRAYSTFSIRDQIRAQREYWYPKLYEGKNPDWIELFKDKLDIDQFPGTLREMLGKGDYYQTGNWAQFKKLLHAGLAEHLGIPASKIVHADHHACHAAYAYWGSPFRDQPTLVLTADAIGDGRSATVSVAKDGRIERVHSVPHTEFQLARLYRYVTLILGMKANEHEYKVMGMAPYAKPQVLKGPYEVFKETMYVDGLGFKWKVRPKDMYFHFRDKLEGYRFDGIAGGLQKYTEEILQEWVGNAVRRTGIGRLVFSGGIAMNIKAHKTLHEMPEVKDLYVCGSAGDESLALGVCFHMMEKHCAESGRGTDCIRPHSMYLGPRFSIEEVRRWARGKGLSSRYQLSERVTPEAVADLLAEGLVIGRSAGRMEFGARSLGNRSILADPRRRETVDRVNHKIKNRDFWMPFAPSILAERAPDYIVNPKGLRSPVMTIAFDSTPRARLDLPAALHPADHTMRPQVVSKTDNPDYHRLLWAFEKKTGVGGLMNTSFNLHGEPIVCSPDDALHVLEDSEIDAILLEDTMVSRKTPAGPRKSARPAGKARRTVPAA